jgi:hypothetical protein
MQEISVGLLLPGQRCQWFINEKLVRELRVAKNGKLTNLGMSREDLESKGGHYYRELIPPVVK